MQELKVWVDGVQRVVAGITQETSCQEIIYALAHAAGRTGRFVLIERFRSSERSLAPHDKPLQVLAKWGDYANDVQFVLKCVDPQRTLSPPPLGDAKSVTGDLDRSFASTSDASSRFSGRLQAPSHLRNLSFSSELQSAGHRGPSRVAVRAVPPSPTGSQPPVSRPPPPTYERFMSARRSKLTAAVPPQPQLPPHHHHQRQQYHRPQEQYQTEYQQPAPASSNLYGQAKTLGDQQSFLRRLEVDIAAAVEERRLRDVELDAMSAEIRRLEGEERRLEQALIQLNSAGDQDTALVVAVKETEAVGDETERLKHQLAAIEVSLTEKTVLESSLRAQIEELLTVLLDEEERALEASGRELEEKAKTIEELIRSRKAAMTSTPVSTPAATPAPPPATTAAAVATTTTTMMMTMTTATTTASPNQQSLSKALDDLISLDGNSKTADGEAKAKTQQGVWV